MVQLAVLFLQQPVPPNTPITPIIVQVTETPVKEIGVFDILLGSLGITGLLLVASALLGVAVAAVLFWVRRRFTPEPEAASLASAQLNLTPQPPRQPEPASAPSTRPGR
ncbi:MAG: hypothetical protein H6Q10_2 [Acidobacteria bacterium]|nr:hypothetical protein [Acidobacteriota bacterium]